MRTIRRRRRDSSPQPAYRRSPPVAIRWATPADARRLEHLAELDGATVPPPPVLLGLVGEELWVAASLSSTAVIADPFRPSAEIAQLVIERGRQLTVAIPQRARSGAMHVRPRRRTTRSLGPTTRLGQESS